MINSELLGQPKNIRHKKGSCSETSLHISTDSRNFNPGSVFIALEGESFDGYDYINKILALEPKAIIYNFCESRREYIENLNHECLMIGVENTLEYMQELAKLHIDSWRNRTEGKVLSITGSNGKTTNKEMLFELMKSVLGNGIYSTQGNFNNHIGVPLTLFGVNDDHKFVIVEMGTNHTGEIETLCKIATPDIGFITNIGSSHLEFFKTEKNVFVEKRALYESIRKKDGQFFVNTDDKFLKKLKYGERIGQKSGDHLVEVVDGGFKLTGKYQAEIKNENLIGDFNFLNLATCYIVATSLLGENKMIQEAASRFKPRNNRSVLIRKDERDYFLDAYNANPSSMESSIKSFTTHCSRKGYSPGEILIILGDMNELGHLAEKAHCLMGKIVKDLGLKNVAFVGRYAENYRKGYGPNSKAFKNVSEINHDKFFQNFKICFIKGSRSLKLETLVDMS